MPTMTAEDALARLRDGNRRFASGTAAAPNRSAGRRRELLEAQSPVAAVLGCADSRVPPEIILDQGLGDLFVTRVAGNIVTPSQVGTIEFAAKVLGTRLVVVLGHSRCGAVEATLAEVERPSEDLSRGFETIVEAIRPSVEASLRDELLSGRDARVRHAVRANVATSVEGLRRESTVLESLVEREGLRIVGAEYSVATGVVEFFEGFV